MVKVAQRLDTRAATAYASFIKRSSFNLPAFEITATQLDSSVQAFIDKRAPQFHPESIQGQTS
jgi:anthranilate/para-aminobenzoate synthase component II